MDHVVYLDSKAKELENLLNKSKTMIIRGAMGRKLPHSRVNEKDTLYFINNNAEGQIKAKASVSFVFNSEKMTTEESKQLISKYQPQLQLTDAQFQRWAGKRYLVLISLKDIKEIPPFVIDKSCFGNMDDWLLVEKIENVKKKHLIHL